ncbi:MAG: sigma-70 family RNA polymerase sigma factor [candidate division WOR-3 bacterium]|nr:MAG: sigma-70 family RNA polymerase sigma factor [candidate division WOR-3 bacterium]
MYNNIESDEALIQSVKNGDCDAFGPIVERYKMALYKVMYRMVMNRDDAEDLVEEAFIKAYRSIKKFQTGRPFYSWLRRIAVNNAINFLKRERRSNVGPLEYVENTLSNGRNDPAQMIRDKMLRERISAAIARLPEDARIILSLKVEEDLSYDEIGKLLKIPKGTVMSRLARARMKLKQIFEDMEVQKHEM